MPRRSPELAVALTGLRIYRPGVPTSVITFQAALDDAHSRPWPRAVLLGNGFSIDWNADIFRYQSLYDEATLHGLRVDKAGLFDGLRTMDFERVVEFLTKAALLVELYEPSDPALASKLRADATVVRNGLADVIAARHPPLPSAISDAEAEMARQFLAEFDTIFTVNYDLLLYWVLNRVDNTNVQPPRADGFHRSATTGSNEYLVFKRRLADAIAVVFWLHGGLHLFVEDDKVYKLRYSTTPLITQIKANLDAGLYPLVVTEGSSEEKQAQIGQNRYLSYANNRFRDLSGCLFIHGMSLSDKDDHLLEALSAKDSDIEVIYVSIHGNKTTVANRRIISRAESIAEARSDNGGRKLEVFFYRADSAHVWRTVGRRRSRTQADPAGRTART